KPKPFMANTLASLGSSEVRKEAEEGKAEPGRTITAARAGGIDSLFQETTAGAIKMNRIRYQKHALNTPLFKHGPTSRRVFVRRPRLIFQNYVPGINSQLDQKRLHQISAWRPRGLGIWLAAGNDYETRRPLLVHIGRVKAAVNRGLIQFRTVRIVLGSEY